MAPSFSKYAILQGSGDYFCLICEKYFISEEETFIHVSSCTHQRNLSSTEYVDGFVEDGIKKITNGKYFCELCNKLLATLSRVHSHLTELTHKDKKIYHILKRNTNKIVVAFEQLVINEQSCHGLQNNSCVLCNIDYADEELHKVEISHVLNLIEYKVKFDKNKNIYRKVDEESFQCLTCNSVLAMQNLTSHFNEVEHNSIYQTCCETYEKIKDLPKEKLTNMNVVTNQLLKSEQNASITLSNNQEKVPIGLDNGTKKVKHESPKINKTLKSTTEKDKDNLMIHYFSDQFQRNGIDLDFESKSATCNKCKIALEYDFRTIRQHFKDHNMRAATEYRKKLAKFPSGSDKLAGRKNSLFASPVHLKNDTGDEISKSGDTIKGKIVAKNLIKSRIAKTELKKTVLLKMPMLDFVKSIIMIQNHMFKDVIVNGKFVINFLSFCCIAQDTQYIFKCVLCEESMTFYEILYHIRTPLHDKAINECPVIFQVDSEFITEVQSERYHCGFCNIVKASWDETLEHLQTTSHKECKISASLRLTQYEMECAKNGIERHNTEKLNFELFKSFF